MSYRFRQFSISPLMLDAIRRYIVDGLPPGHFLTAIIDNDLREAVMRADDENMPNIPAFVAYFYNEAPADCWGSSHKRQDWIASIRKKQKETELRERIERCEDNDRPTTGDD
jgi:hypothetical protein